MHEILKDYSYLKWRYVCHLTTCNLEPSQLRFLFVFKWRQFSQKTEKLEKAARVVYAAAVITIDSYVRAN